jgi:hypothetical protein
MTHDTYCGRKGLGLRNVAYAAPTRPGPLALLTNLVASDLWRGDLTQPSVIRVERIPVYDSL